MKNYTKKVGTVFASFLILLVLWQVGIQYSGVSNALFPTPLQVGKALKKLMESGALWNHIQASMYRFFIGYCLAVIVAVFLGVFFGWWKKAYEFVHPVVQLLRPISPMAWLPFIVLWFGIGDIPAMVIIFIAAFFPVFLSTIGAVRSVDDTYIKVAQNFGLKKRDFVVDIIFPAAFPRISSGIHLAIGTAWIFLVAGEMVGTQSGLGYLIIDARNELDVAILLAAILVIGLLGFLLDSVIHVFEKIIFRKWGITQ